VFVIGVLCLFPGGCARVPTTNRPNTSKVLVVSFTTRGPLDINRQPQGSYYFVLINRADSPTDPGGPAPVIGPPWGNGFAAAPTQDGQGFIGFVLYSRDQGLINNVGVYSSQIGGQLVDPRTLRLGGFTSLGPPDRLPNGTPQDGDTTLTFQLDLGRLPQSERRFLQINVIATDVLPNSPESVAKRWDALGDGTQTGSLNNWITIDTSTNQTLTNSQITGTSQEIPNDVRDRLGPVTDDASLDIIDWTFQIRDP
jgi:hypothetical protein